MQFLYFAIFISDTIFGIFLNVCIYRIPKGEDIVKEPSHYQGCGYRRSWKDLIPIVSWLLLHGTCRKCKEKISIQYPLIEALNGIIWIITFILCKSSSENIIYCLFISALLVLSVIDVRTYEIPFGINICIVLLGVIHILMDIEHYLTYITGFFLVSGIFFICAYITKGKGMGGGDTKLMASQACFLDGNTFCWQ